MANIIDVKKKLNSLVHKSKPTDEGFSYICQLDGYQCIGRKSIIEYLKEKHEDKYLDLRSGFEDDKEFQSQLSKLVMSVPYTDKDANITSVKKKILVKKVDEETNETEDKVEDIVEVNADKKNYPLTLDYMRNIDARTTKIPNYGSLVGRIARLMALLLKREKTEAGDIKIFLRNTDEAVGGCQDIHGYIEANHPQFLENLIAMFPPAKKRMEQFLQKAAENFDLIVPTWQLVERLQKVESDKAAAERKKEMEERLQKAKEARAEMLNRKKKESEERLARKRKQAEEEKHEEFKMMKINPNSENAEEILKLKKEIHRIETALKHKNLSEKNRSNLRGKNADQREKLRNILRSNREKRINKRLADCLENLSPKQLRKLSMEYLNNIESLDQVNWAALCQTVKIDDDFEYLADFLGCLYEMAKFHGKKGFKVGHVLITTKQSVAIVERGIRSVRDGITEAFRIPSSWDMDNPGEDLGQEWNRKTDSQLLVGASRFGKNLLKIVSSDPQLSAMSLDSNGAVKEAVRRRFGHLINVYITRGQPTEEFGTSLYSVDIEDEEEYDHHLDGEAEEVQQVEEIPVGKKNAENKENQANNGIQKSKEEDPKEKETEEELITLDDDEDDEELNHDPDEEINEHLLDDSD